MLKGPMDFFIVIHLSYVRFDFFSMCTRRHGGQVGVLNNSEKVFWEFGSITVQNASDILLLFCTSTWPSNHESASQD